MSVVGMVCALNEEEFLDDFITKTLKLVDKLVISEGGVVGNPFTDESGHSIDSTNEIIKSSKKHYGDRIVWLTSKGNDKWKDKQMQQNAMLKFAETGDWILVLGADEFYDIGTRAKLDVLIEKYPYISEFVFSIKHLWENDKILTNKGEYRTVRRHQRFFKKQDEMFYANHPTINDVNNLDTFFNERYMQKKMYLDIPEELEKAPDESFKIGQWNKDADEAIITYHYGFYRDKGHQIKKHIYYMMREKSKSFKEMFDFLKMYTGNEIDRLYSYIHTARGFAVTSDDSHHPLKDRDVVDSHINLDEIEKLIGEFRESAKK